MARYIGPMTKKSRRLGVDLVGGDAAFERRPYAPGQHGRARIKESEYRNQLQEKQKARFTYGVMEKQFHNYYDEASRRPGKTGDNLLELLERRLDNVVFRMGFASSRAQARQLVSHGHFAVNGRPTNVPSYATKVGDRVEVRESRRGREIFKVAAETMKAAQIPEWVSVDPAKLSGSVLSEPAREQMPLEFNEQLVVEYYSR